MLLKRLSEAFGPSGKEHEVRALLSEELKSHVDELKTDRLGNLIAIKRGKAAGPKVMLAAHMDEVGLMVVGINSQGLLQFRKVGGIDDRVLVSKQVLVGKNKINGVIGAKAIHLQKRQERSQVIPHDAMYIDIGARSKEEAQKYVNIGDYAVFATQFAEFGDGYYKGKAFDDRTGCAVLAEILKRDYQIPVYGTFTVQEEVGLRGAGVAAYTVEPDMAIVLEGTTCSDIPETKEHGYCTTLGEGPAITIMDASVITNKKMVAKLFELADQHSIPVQIKRSITGGSDAGRISQSKGGVPTVVVSVPCRYIHSPVSVCKKTDLDFTIKLVDLFLKSIEGGFRA